MKTSFITSFACLPIKKNPMYLTEYRPKKSPYYVNQIKIQYQSLINLSDVIEIGNQNDKTEKCNSVLY